MRVCVFASTCVETWVCSLPSHHSITRPMPPYPMYMRRAAEAFAALAATRQQETTAAAVAAAEEVEERGKRLAALQAGAREGEEDGAARAITAAAASGEKGPSALVAQARREVDLLPHHDNLPATGYALNNADLVSGCLFVRIVIQIWHRL